MNSKLLGTGIVALALVGLAGASFTSAPRTERIDFGAAPRAVGAVYNPTLAPASAAPVKEFRIPIRDAKLEIASGVRYNGWSFGGTVPGPVIRVREGDLVRILLVNEASLPHSIDFHAARIPMNVAFRTIVPRDSLAFEFVARDPGAYLVHCGTPPVLLHLMQGMYLPIIVDPKRSEEHTSELQSHSDLVCRLLLEKKNITSHTHTASTHTSRAKQNVPTIS